MAEEQAGAASGEPMPPGSSPAAAGRRRIFVVLLVLFNVVLLEGGSFLILDALMRRQANYVVPTGRFVVDGLRDEQIAWFFRDGHDPDLGWTVRPNITDRSFVNRFDVEWAFSTDARGARRSGGPDPGATPWAATFGDSFMFGYEVDDDETFQAVLGRRLDRSVANYGVAGYGPGQALLRFEKELRHGLRPRVVMLATFEENVLRVINRFRPFYAVGSPLRLGFKPRFDFDADGELIVVPPEVIGPTTDRDELAAAVDASVDGDFWAETRAKVEPSYFANLLRLTYFQACHAYRGSSLVDVWPRVCRGYYGPTWKSESTGELMDAIYRRFVEVARAHDVRPVLLFLSRHEEPYYRHYLGRLRDAVGPDVPIVDIADAGIDRELLHDPTRLHFAPAVWEALAEHVASELVAAGWVDPSEDHAGDGGGGEGRQSATGEGPPGEL